MFYFPLKGAPAYVHVGGCYQPEFCWKKSQHSPQRKT